MIENIEDFFSDIVDWFETKYYQTIYGIENLFIWFKIVWNDRDWDDYFLTKLMHFKIKRMEKAFRSNKAVSMPAERNANEMMRTAAALKRLMDDEYFAMVFKRHDEKWGKYKMFTEEADGKSFFNLERKNANTPEEKEQERKEFLKCCEHEGYLQQQDLDYAMDQMKKHLRGWWD